MKTLSKSFERLSVAVDNTTVAWRLIIAMLVIHSGLLMYSAYVHSPTLNEPGHLVAGLSHWKFGRFELYRVNPPLVRMVSAIPVMAAGYEEDWTGFYEGPGARPVFSMGEDFVAANGPRTFYLMMIARWACMPFSWLGAIICYLWARDLYGRQAGLLACFLWCFSPNILAHASLITADAHASALGVAACYTLWRWLKRPTWAQAAITGVVLGLAELAKTTLILFYPLWPLMWLIYRWPNRLKMKTKDWANEAGMLALRMIIGLYLINLGYGFEGSFKPLGEYEFVSELFTTESQSDGRRNRFSESILAKVPVPFPENYLLGIDVQQRDFEDYGRPFYLRGEWSDEGWWYYYLYAALIKIPLATWIIGCFSLVLGVIHLSKSSWHNEFILLLPAVIVFAVVSSKTGINEHFRYVLPCFPFVFIWFGHTLAGPNNEIEEIYVDNNMQVSIKSGVVTSRISEVCFRWVGSPIATTCLLTCLSTWAVLSSAWIYPHSLSYFNESIGGPLNGVEHLQGSSSDWGQDLRYAIDAMSQMPACSTLAYAGYCDPSALGVIVEGKRATCDEFAWLLASQNYFCKGYPSIYYVGDKYRAKHLRALLVDQEPDHKFTYTIVGFVLIEELSL